MGHHDNRPIRQDRANRFAPSLEGLESRRLLSFFSPYWYSSSYSYNQLYYQAAVVRHEYDTYVSGLKRLELASQATPVEYLALRDDARAISAAASSTKLSHTAAQYKAVEVSLQLDRAPLYGWLDAAGWSGITTTLTTDLNGLNVPQSVINQTVTDMKTLAVSAGVGPDGFATFTDNFNTLRNGEQTLPSGSGYHFEDPSLYYTQHLRGFFRGWGVQKLQAQAALQNDLRTIQGESQAVPANSAVLHRDVQILQNLGTAVPSATMNAFNTTYVAAFDQGAPTPADLSQLQSSLVAILGPASTAHRVASVNRLVADAPSFYQAAGASVSNIQTIVDDVGTLVNAGGGEALNPFKVTIQPDFRHKPAG